MIMRNAVLVASWNLISCIFIFYFILDEVTKNVFLFFLVNNNDHPNLKIKRHIYIFMYKDTIYKVEK